MSKRIIKETVREYDADGRLLKETVTETVDDDIVLYPQQIGQNPYGIPHIEKEVWWSIEPTSTCY